MTSQPFPFAPQAHRTGFAASALTALAVALAGCATNTKLDEPGKGAPVESRVPGSVNPAAGAAAANPNPTPQSSVATVDLAGKAGAAGAGAMADALRQRVVYFDFDSFVIKDEYKVLLDAHAKALTTAKGKHMVVEGHTDERGGREYNLALGQRRAEVVVKTLQLMGARASDLEATSFGEERPADAGHDEAAWVKNRRADLNYLSR